MKAKQIITLLFTLLISVGCSLSPGMHMNTSSGWIEDNEFIYVGKNKEFKIFIERIEDNLVKDKNKLEPYRIGIGDKISVTVWGLPEAFPMTNIGLEQTLRTVNTDGTIFFPYAGVTNAAGLTQVELRSKLTNELSKYFSNPQLDISIARFESQSIYVLGEVTKPQKIEITETPLSLADALGTVYGLNTNTSSGDQVFIIRQANTDDNAKIFRADLSSPSSYIAAGDFYLKSKDIVYVNAKGTTRWNRVISQFFPFTTFLNSVDNLTEN